MRHGCSMAAASLGWQLGDPVLVTVFAGARYPTPSTISVLQSLMRLPA